MGAPLPVLLVNDEMFSKSLEAIVKRARQNISRHAAGVGNAHSEGFWVKGGSLVYVPAGQVHEVQSVIQQHREFEAKLAVQGMLMRH